jgi:KpsF/GutQ family protein
VFPWLKLNVYDFESAREFYALKRRPSPISLIVLMRLKVPSMHYFIAMAVSLLRGLENLALSAENSRHLSEYRDSGLSAPTEAHRRSGMIVKGDIVLLVSNSGETEELIRLLKTLKRLGIFLIAMVGNPQSSMARHSDIVLDASIRQEACPLGLAPTASTTAALALGDALAIALYEKRGFKEENFASLHPGGIDKKLMTVEKLMHSGNAIPAVDVGTSMQAVIMEISEKGMGVTAVIQDGSRVAGIITDGDLRRLLQKDVNFLKKKAGECGTEAADHRTAICWQLQLCKSWKSENYLAAGNDERGETRRNHPHS